MQNGLILIDAQESFRQRPYFTPATLTRDMQHLDGTLLPATMARTAAVLTERFARICTVEQALEGAAA